MPTREPVPQPITSRQNSWFRRFRDAAETRQHEILLEGRKQVADALAAGWEPLAIAASDDAIERFGPAPLLRFSRPLLEAISDTVTPQGVVGLFARPVHSAEEILSRTDAVVVALDDVQDPGNVGTIIRLAAAFEAAGVILIGASADAYAPKAIRASAGTILDVPVARVARAEFLETVSAASIPLVVASADGDTRGSLTRPSVLVLGSEGRGVSPDIAAAATVRLAVPMSRRVESLNVASAAAILLARCYEARSAG